MPESPAPASILVLGVGNPLMGDDGAGPRVVELLLEGYRFPEHVTVLDAGTMGFALLAALREVDHALVVDSIRDTGHAPGTVVRLTPDQIAPSQIKHSMHDVALIDVLQAAELAGHAPQTVAIGVQITSLEEAVTRLTPAVESAVPVAAAAVLDELAALGVTPAEVPNSPVPAAIAAALARHRHADR